MWFRRPERRQDKESTEALRDAHKNLEKAKARTTEVHEVANALKGLRERNHFAERLLIIMGGTANEL